MRSVIKNISNSQFYHTLVLIKKMKPKNNVNNSLN